MIWAAHGGHTEPILHRERAELTPSATCPPHSCFSPTFKLPQAGPTQESSPFSPACLSSWLLCPPSLMEAATSLVHSLRCCLWGQGLPRATSRALHHFFQPRLDIIQTECPGGVPAPSWRNSRTRGRDSQGAQAGY